MSGGQVELGDWDWGAGEKSWESLCIAGRSNQSVLKEINPEYILEGLMLKFQYFGHLCEELTQWKRPWCWQRLKAGGEGGRRGWNDWIASLTQWTCEQTPGDSQGQRNPADCSPWGSKESTHCPTRAFRPGLVSIFEKPQQWESLKIKLSSLKYVYIQLHRTRKVK